MDKRFSRRIKIRDDHYDAMMRGDHGYETALCRQFGLSHDINEIHSQNAKEVMIPNFAWWINSPDLCGKIFREIESEMDSIFH